MTHYSLLWCGREAELKRKQKRQKLCFLNQQFTWLSVDIVCSRAIFHLSAMLSFGETDKVSPFFLEHMCNLCSRLKCNRNYTEISKTISLAQESIKDILNMERESIALKSLKDIFKGHRSITAFPTNRPF